MDSPPMTPPESDAHHDSECVAELTQDVVSANRSNSMLNLSARSLNAQLADLEILAQTKRTQSDYPTPESATNDELLTILNHSLRYMRCVLLILEEIDAEDDIGYAQENQSALFAVEKALTSYEPYFQSQTTLIDAVLKVAAHAENLSDIKRDQSDLMRVWDRSKSLVSRIKFQYLAVTDWKDCQDSLDAIQNELKEMKTSMYTIQEQRHVALVPAIALELDVLTTILEDAPEGENTGTPGKKVNEDGLSKWDRALSETMTKLTSKLGPLKASIAMFQPRLESFELRAREQFPSAVRESRERYDRLRTGFDQLIEKFRTLKQELSEDKWVAVFRQVNKQATEMMASLQRTLKKLDSIAFTNPETKRLAETFEMKAEHYGKSIPAVLSIMYRGVKERLTLNGEVIRGYDVLTRQWAQLSIDLADMARRLRGARAAGLLLSDEQIISQKLRPNTGIATPRFGRRETSQASQTRSRAASQRQGNEYTYRTPQRPAKRSDNFNPARNYSPSPALPSFRKDMSLDPPRSRSRLSNAREGGIATNTKPPWNGGTIARVLDHTGLSVPSSPLRTPSRCTSRLGGISGQLERANNMSYIPLSKTRDTDLRPREATSPRKSDVKHPAVSKLSKSVAGDCKAPSTPSTQRYAMSRPPKTPSSIAIPRRLVSNPESMIPTPMRPRTASALGLSIASRSTSERVKSALSNRGQSSIPLPSPHKQTNH